MRPCLVLCSIAALAAAQRQCGPPDDRGTDGEDWCANDAGAAAATQRFKIDINVDGEPRPLGFLRGDDLNDVARRWVAANTIVGEDAVRMLVKRMRTKVEEAPALDGEALGCPALAYEYKMDTPPELAAFTQRASSIAGPGGRLVLTMATGGYAAFARSWARGLDAVNVSHFLVAALDDVALTELKPLGDHVVPVYEDATDGDDAPGRDEPAAYGSGAFRALTQIKPALVLALLEANLTILYADADVAFLRDPWPHLTSYESCAVALQPNRRDEHDVLGAIVELDRRPGNPRPRQRYYGDVGCSGLAYFPSGRAARRLAAFWTAAASAASCGGDQAALESALAFLAYAAEHVDARALSLALFPNGMALRTVHGAPAPEAGTPFGIPPGVVAFHANYVVGASNKRAWLESLGLWFG
jgi:hypothetical protein